MKHRMSRHQAMGLVGGLLVSLIGLTSTVQAQPVSSYIAPFWNALTLQPAPPDDLWDRLRDNFQWQIDIKKPRVQKWIEYYQDRPGSIAAIAEQARPWLHWVILELERRELPGEIALLPFVESAYDPSAHHPGGATGLWQVMPTTGDALGLRRDWWYDGRMDVVASTRAALDYLEFQADYWYDGDSELALAAYNAGASRVNRALRDAVSRGVPADYWHLRLPRETMNYVPKLLAISKIISDPERFGVNLPTIPDQPFFAKVEIDHQLDLAQLAELSGIDISTLEALNPALLQDTTIPRRSPLLLVPYDRRDSLLGALEQLDESTSIASWKNYEVQPGDTLSQIAMRYSVPIGILREQNRLDGEMIRIGQRLRVPLSDSTGNFQDQLVVHVQAGDSLSVIAARHNVSVDDIARWNGLNTEKYIQPGQRLTLRETD